MSTAHGRRHIILLPLGKSPHVTKIRVSKHAKAKRPKEAGRNKHEPIGTPMRIEESKNMLRYLSPRIPRSISPGRVLMHNHVRHTVDMPSGLNGFRAWTDNAVTNDEFKPCHCGWSGLPHFSRRPDTPCLEKLSPSDEKFKEEMKTWSSRESVMVAFTNE